MKKMTVKMNIALLRRIYPRGIHCFPFQNGNLLQNLPPSEVLDTFCCLVALLNAHTVV
jgi:hypothetical protein